MLLLCNFVIFTSWWTKCDDMNLKTQRLAAIRSADTWRWGAFWTMGAEEARWSALPPLFASPEWIADPPAWPCHRLAPRSISLALENKILLKAGDVTQSPETCARMEPYWEIYLNKWRKLNWKCCQTIKGICQGIWICTPIFPSDSNLHAIEVFNAFKEWCIIELHAGIIVYV